MQFIITVKSTNGKKIARFLITAFIFIFANKIIAILIAKATNITILFGIKNILVV